MKFLIYDYSEHWNTESTYFSTAINLINTKDKNIKAEIYDKEMSLYDNFDRYKPDVFITSINKINKDLINYIQNAQNKIKVLINVNQEKEDIVNGLIDTLNNLESDIFFFGTKKIEKPKYISILPGADIFLPKYPKEYNIDKLIFVNTIDRKNQSGGTYHYTSTMFDKNFAEQELDIVLDEKQLARVFVNYKEIVFKHSEYIGTQVFFDAIYSGVKVTIDTPEDNTDSLNELFKHQNFLKATKSRHTCLHRLKSLMNYASIDLSDYINQMVEKI